MGTANFDRLGLPLADSKIAVFHLAAEGGSLMLRRFAILLLPSLGAASLAATDAKKSKQREVKVQKSSVSRDQWAFSLGAPTSQFDKKEPIFRKMIQTIKFGD